MAVRATPLWIAAGCYTDTDLRAYMAMLDNPCPSGGIRKLTGGEMLVTAAGGMNVSVAPGTAWIAGTDAAGQGLYLVDNPTATTLTVTTANPTNPRIDRVIAKVNDPAFTGSGSPVFSLQILAGTPAGSPAAPATPASAISLATISVPATDTVIDAAQITDTRTFCPVRRGYRGRRVTGASAGNGGGTVIGVTWDTEDFDSDGFGSTASGVLTIPAGLDGVYATSAMEHILGGTTGNHGISLLHNGVVVRYGNVPTNQTTRDTVSVVLQLVAGDTIQWQMFQTTGVAQNYDGRVELWRLLPA